MNNSAAPSKLSTKPTSTVTYLHLRDRTAELPPIRYPWTEELERRRKLLYNQRARPAPAA